MSSIPLISKFLGPRYFQMARNWTSTAGFFGGSAGLALLYFTEWKAVLKYVPLYGGKYPSESESSK